MSMLRMTQEELTNVQARIARSTKDMRDKPMVRSHQKYRNEKVEEGDKKFDSKAEHKRWQYLDALEKAGEITDLRMQVPFELIPAQVAPDGRKIRPTSYIADFIYTANDGSLVCEDVKGYATPEWRIKRKLMLQVHGVWVREIRS